MQALVWEELRKVFDPEIPVNIVELGLVYGCEVTAIENGGYRVAVTMTLTAPGCAVGDLIRQEILERLESLPDVHGATVEIVFEPPWSPQRMSEAARLELGMEDY